MTKKQLNEIRHRVREIEQLQEQLEVMEARLYYPKGQALSPTSGGDGSGRAMEDIVAAHVNLRERYIRRVAELERMQMLLEDAISVLSITERVLIRYRYLSDMTWEEVADSMVYSLPHIHRLHSRILQKLAESE